MLDTLIGHTRAISALVMSSDGKLLISGSLDKTIRVWNLSTGREVHTLIGHTSGVEHLVMSPVRMAVSLF